MSLFNNKTIHKHLPKSPKIPEEHLTVINNWADQIKNGTFKSMKETAVHSSFMQQIMVQLLGYSSVGSVPDGECFTIAQEFKIGKGPVDLALGEFYNHDDPNSIFAPLELKGAKAKNLDALIPGRHETPVEQAFRYAASMKGAKWVLLSNYVELRMYATSEGNLVYESFMLEALSDPFEYARFQLLLNKENFLTGRTERILKESENADKEISDKLYIDYKHLRENMLANMIKDNPSFEPVDLIAPAQKLLDRVLFVSFAEDKGLIPDNSIKQAYEHNDPYNPRPVYQNFIGLFNAIYHGNKQLDIPAYQGTIFTKDEQLDNLVISDELCEGFKELAEYDFDSEVSVTVLGRIFEQSIADLEVLTENIHEGAVPKVKAKPKAVSGKRKKEGVVYTPDNITQFIVANTLGTHIDEQFDLLFAEFGKEKSDGSIQWKKGSKTELKFWYAWQDKLKTIKIVDPACGSGAFLVAAFDYLHAEYEKSNEKLAELTHQRSILDLNKEILNNNLFGVDVNSESIEITKLSLWLKTAERGKPLESLNDNFFVGNSLGFDEPAPEDTFTWKGAFKEIFDNGGFDVVLGNPPYVRQELLGDIKLWLEQTYSVYNGVLDLYGYFFELGIKLLKLNGRMAYISSSTFFKTGSGEKLREHLSSQVTLEKIIDFGDLQVFEGVTTYPAILVINNKVPDTSHKIAILPLRDKLPESLDMAFEQQSGLMNQSQLGSTSWQLEDEKLHNLRQKLTANLRTLKDAYGSPSYGIKTGFNEAFVIDKATRDSIVRADPTSAEIIKPFLEGKDLKRWHAQSREVYLIAVPKFWTRNQLGKNKDELIEEVDAWAWFSTNYPALANWLTSFQERGKKRGDKGEFWWELRACAYYEEFKKPKIFYPDITDSPKFHLNKNGAFSSNTGYFLSVDNTAIAGYLNSKLVWFFLKGICDSVRGGFYRMFSQNINQIPIPPDIDSIKLSNLTSELHDKTEIRYKIENDLRRLLKSLCPEDQAFKINKKLDSWWLLDFEGFKKEIKKSFKGEIPLKNLLEWEDLFNEKQKEREEIDLTCNRLERELNQEVYKLFDLTSEEIKLIEKNSF